MKTSNIAEFGINDLLQGALGIAVLGLAVSYILQMNGEVGRELCVYQGDTGCVNATGGTAGVPLSQEYNASVDTSTGLSKITSKIGIIAGALAIGVVLAIIIRAFAFGGINRQ